MFDKLHLLSQDVPEGGDGFRWRAHPYLRMAGAVPRGPAVFEWSARQRADLEALWRDPTTDGPRERLAKDLAAFCERLGWNPDVKVLEEAEQNGEEYILTLSAVSPELYILPWEVVRVGAEGQVPVGLRERAGPLRDAGAGGAVDRGGAGGAGGAAGVVARGRGGAERGAGGGDPGGGRGGRRGVPASWRTPMRSACRRRWRPGRRRCCTCCVTACRGTTGSRRG